jgi:hypothetical protein
LTHERNPAAREDAAESSMPVAGAHILTCAVSDSVAEKLSRRASGITMLNEVLLAAGRASGGSRLLALASSPPRFAQRGLPWQPLVVPGFSQQSVPAHVVVAGTLQQYQPAESEP